ncbi:hypothetical protein G6F32_015465 [Rhizopus arrhizus]|nr:hypothetical protein G6F32_015465 [Rhizopus arrhizus]
MRSTKTRASTNRDSSSPTVLPTCSLRAKRGQQPGAAHGAEDVADGIGNRNAVDPLLLGRRIHAQADDRVGSPAHHRRNGLRP